MNKTQLLIQTARVLTSVWPLSARFKFSIAKCCGLESDMIMGKKQTESVKAGVADVINL